MAQKTNPVSLRLQKTNKCFDSSWYSDYFYTDFIMNELETRLYVEHIFTQLNYPMPYVFVQRLYKRLGLYAFIFDPRGARQQKIYQFQLQKIKFLQIPFSSSAFKLSKKFYIATDFIGLFQTKKLTRTSTLVQQKVVHKMFIACKSIFTPQIQFDVKTKNDFQKQKKIDPSQLRKRALFRYLLLQAQLKKKQNFILNKVIYNSFFLNLYNENRRFINHSFHITSLKERNALNTGCTITDPLLGNSVVTKKSSKDFHYQSHLERVLSNQLQNLVSFYPIRIMWELQSASFLAEEIVFFLQRRVPFRRIKEHILRQVSSISIIKGVRLSCSGRLGGRSKKAQKSRIESAHWGQTSLNVFSSRLCFASKSALTPFGKVGIKVWLCFK